MTPQWQPCVPSSAPTWRVIPVPKVSHSPDFRRALKSITQGELLIAPLRAYLYDPNFKGFDVKVRGIGKRDPDDWFHPSTHPSWSERALYLYVLHPEVLITEPMNPMAVLSMTAGSIWHSIIGRILCDELSIVEQLEVPVKCMETKAMGHMDGIVGDSIFEFKTAKDMALAKIGSAEDYIRRYPGYYLQAMEYMRMSGYRSERVLVMALTYPYEMREFVIEWDQAVANQTSEKYLRVRQAVADQRMPDCSGCASAVECPARAMCDHLFREAI